MVSEIKEQQKRFESLIGTNFPCNRCPVQNACEKAMKEVKSEKDLDNCPTCEETLFYWVVQGTFLNNYEER